MNGHITVKQMAQVTQIPLPTLRHHLYVAKDLPHQVRGHTVYVHMNDVQQFAARYKRPADVLSTLEVAHRTGLHITTVNRRLKGHKPNCTIWHTRYYDVKTVKTLFGIEINPPEVGELDAPASS